jgi:hypothetical protein
MFEKDKVYTMTVLIDLGNNLENTALLHQPYSMNLPDK